MRDGDGQIFYLDFPIPDYNNEFIRLACSNYMHEITPELTDCVHEYIQDNVHWLLFDVFTNFDCRHYRFVKELEEKHGVILAGRDYAYHERDMKIYAHSRFRPHAITRMSPYLERNRGPLSYVAPDKFITLVHVAIESYIVKAFMECAKERIGTVLDASIPYVFLESCRAYLTYLSIPYTADYSRLFADTGHEFMFKRENDRANQHPIIYFVCSEDFSQMDVHLDLPNLGRSPGGTWCIPGIDFFLPKSVCVRLK